MEIILSKFKQHEHSSAFDDFRLYMKPIVDSAIGWDENFQRTSFESKLKPEWFSWILCNGKKVAMYAVALNRVVSTSTCSLSTRIVKGKVSHQRSFKNSNNRQIHSNWI